jgi:uncharacterized protein YhfF
MSTVAGMWARVNELRTLGLGTPGDMRADLNALVLAGTKTATAGLLAESTGVTCTPGSGRTTV